MKVILVHHEPGSARAESLYQALAEAMQAILGVPVDRETPTTIRGKKPDGVVVSLFALPGPHHKTVAAWAGPRLAAGPVPTSLLALHAARLTPPGAEEAQLGYVAHGAPEEKRRWAEKVAEQASRLTGKQYRPTPLPCNGHCIPLVMGPGRHSGGAPTILEVSLDLILAWLTPTLQHALDKTRNIP